MPGVTSATRSTVSSRSTMGKVTTERGLRVDMTGSSRGGTSMGFGRRTAGPAGPAAAGTGRAARFRRHGPAAVRSGYWPATAFCSSGTSCSVAHDALSASG